MFGPKKTKVSKADLKKAAVNANERLKSANTRMEADIEAGKGELKLLESKHKEALKALKDTQDLQGYAKNELEALQEDVESAASQAKKALGKVTRLAKESASLEESNKNLEAKKDKLSRTISLLESRKEELAILTCDLKQIRKESAVGQETLELLAIELNELEGGVESYISRKSAAESEFRTFTGEIERAKRIAEEELREVENLGKTMKLIKGEEMGRLDHSIADRMSELEDLDELKRRKEYDLSTVQSKISIVENRVSDAEQRIEYAIKKEQEKVGKIKGDFRSWKVEALDEVARLKIKGKIENINKAGLKEVLDG